MKNRLIALLRWSERYTKTDMVYLATTGWWLNLNVVVTSLLSLLLSVVFANLLSAETYGLYQYLLSLSVLVAAISLAGMNVAVAQAVARGYEGVLRAAVRVQLMWSIVPVSLSLVASLYYLLHGNVAVGLGLVAIGLLTPLSNAFNTYIGFLEGKQEFRRGSLFNNAINAVTYASLFLAVVWTRDATILLLVNLGVNTLATGYAYYRTLKLYTPNDRVDPKTIPYGKHMSILSAFSTIVNQIDTILVFHFLGAAGVALYSLATMLPERAGALFGFIGTASMPKFANHSLTYIRENLLSKIIKVAIISSLVALAYALCAPLLFHLLFPQYLSAIPYSMVYAPIIVLVALTSVTNITLTAKRFTREIYVISFIQPSLLVGLQLPLLLAYGIWGMVAARLISDVIGIALALWFTYHPLHTPEEVIA
jgi:O-antigen/teichoic acid export membrane protein